MKFSLRVSLSWWSLRYSSSCSRTCPSFASSRAFFLAQYCTFAVLGLQPLYFMLAGMIERFVYLSVGLSVVLVFVGAKFFYSGLFDAEVLIWVSLPFIAVAVTG